MVKSMFFSSLTVIYLLFGGLAFAFESPQGFGEDHLSRDELQGEEIYGKSNSQTAWDRYLYTPWNSQTTFGPLSSFEGVVSSRLLPVLQVETNRSQDTYFIVGNEVGDPLYQELKSNKNTANRTPTIQWQFRTSNSIANSQSDTEPLSQSSAIPWAFTLGFEQVDHMSIQSSGLRTKRLGANWEVEEQADAFSWFGSNFPTSSVLYSQLEIGPESWRQSISYQDGYLWWNTGTQHPNPEIHFNELPLNFRQVNWKGQFEDFRWEHQSTSAYMRYTDSTYTGSQPPAEIFEASHLSQHLSRLGVEGLIPGSEGSYLGALSQINQLSYSREDQKDSIMGTQSPQLFAESHWHSLAWMNTQLVSKQSFNDTLYQGTHGLKWDKFYGPWQHTLSAHWNYWTHASLFTEVSPLNPDRPLFYSKWYDLQYSQAKFFGIHILKFDHQYFFAQEEMQSLKETVEFGIHRPGRTRMVARLSYELPWGDAWDLAELRPPTWRYYHNLEFELPTGLVIQPIYTWTSSYVARTSELSRNVPSRHGLHLRLHQKLFRQRLQAWVEMINFLSEDEVLHPVGQEDRLRAIVGASFDF